MDQFSQYNYLLHLPWRERPRLLFRSLPVPNYKPPSDPQQTTVDAGERRTWTSTSHLHPTTQSYFLQTKNLRDLSQNVCKWNDFYCYVFFFLFETLEQFWLTGNCSNSLLLIDKHNIIWKQNEKDIWISWCMGCTDWIYLNICVNHLC